MALSKTEATWIGSKVSCQECPHINPEIIWKTSQFKSLGINFSINLGLIFYLNYKENVCYQIPILPQLLYVFSVLGVEVPTKFLKS